MNEIIKFLSKQEIETASIEQLKAEFSRTLQITSEYLVYMSLIWKALDNRGVDLSNLKKGLMEYIPLIAMKKLDARFVVEHAGNRTLLSALARLRIEKQEEIIVTGGVDVLKDGETLNLDLNQLTLKEVHQVFDAEKGIRNINEQKLYIKAKSKVKRRTKSNDRKNYRQILLDDNNEYLLLGSDAKVKIETVLSMIGELYEIDMFEVMSKYSNRLANK